MQKMAAFSLVLAGWLAGPAASAQEAAATAATRAARMPAGGIVVTDAACPAGSLSGTACKQAVVTCPEVPTASARLRITRDGSVANRGTMLLTTGGAGTSFAWNPTPLAAEWFTSMTGAGLTVVELAWDAPGVWGGPRPRTLACRYATVARWVYADLHAGGKTRPFIAQGTSGGAAQIAFGLVYYGLGDIIAVANLGGGPPGCPLCSPDGQHGPEPLLPGPPPAVNGDPVFDYPNTIVRFFLGDREPTPDIVADANAYFEAITSAKSFQTVADTAHNIEGTPAGVAAFIASVTTALSAARPLPLVSYFKGIDGGRAHPPNPAIAAGLDSLVIASDADVVIRDKSGRLIAARSLADVLAPARAADETPTMPRLAFDHDSRRFFLVAAARRPSCADGCHLLLAVSKTGSPRSLDVADWYVLAVDAATAVDAVSLGFNRDALAVSSVATADRAAQPGARILVLDKARLAAGGVTLRGEFDDVRDPLSGAPVGDLQPALTYEGPTTLFLVAPSGQIACGLNVVGIETASPTPSLAISVAVPAARDDGQRCDRPLTDPAQPGSTPRLDIGGSRIPSQAVFRADSLWVVMQVADTLKPAGVPVIRWVEIDVRDWPRRAELVQDGRVRDDGVSSFQPSIGVDRAGNAGLVLHRAGPFDAPAVFYTGRLASDPPGTMRPPLLLIGSAGALTAGAAAGGRAAWGRYTALAMDPLDDTFWIAGEYARDAETWGVWVGAFRAN